MSRRDLTDADQNERVLRLADELLADPARLADLTAAMADNARLADLDPVLVESVACARSARALADLDRCFHVSVVWAMYRESERMVTRDEHPHGEDFIRVKAAQLDWLADRSPDRLTWHVYAVDDGCPSDPSSGDLADEIVAGAGLDDSITVLRLADAITAATPITDHFHRLGSTDDSRKGGSIALGMHAASAAGPPNASADHVIVYTDADLSTNLAQTGLLLYPLTQGAAAAAGQRYGRPGSVLIKESGPMTEPHSTGGKPDKTIVLFRNAVRAVLIPPLADVLDTQAGFKAFPASVVADALPHLGAFTESFDIELLLHAARVGDAEIASVPIVFTEDFAASNFPSVDPEQRHLDMVTQIIDIHDRLVAPYRHIDAESQAMRGLVAGLTLADYVSIIEHIGASDPHGADDPELFDRRWSAAELSEILG